MKLKRKPIAAKYADAIDAMYASQGLEPQIRWQKKTGAEANRVCARPRPSAPSRPVLVGEAADEQRDPQDRDADRGARVPADQGAARTARAPSIVRPSSTRFRTNATASASPSASGRPERTGAGGGRESDRDPERQCDDHRADDVGSAVGESAKRHVQTPWMTASSRSTTM